MSEEGTVKKEKPVTIEVLMEGPNGELYFQPIPATPEHLEELIAATTNSMIKHNLQKQLERLQKESPAGEGDDTH
ncbi:MAG: hypothetical protein AABW68_03955 [archaeon]